jgi:rSAM/selenodomain-associated transferase 1
MAVCPVSTRIVVLTKVPVPGTVKTRLAAHIGKPAATALHEAMVWETLDRARASGLPVDVSLSGDLDGAFANQLRTSGFPVYAQAKGDLGARMSDALRGPGWRFALGTDCVVFDPKWLQLANVAEQTVCIGPADDGGYWTIGADLRTPGLDEALFSGMTWSQPTVCHTTERRIDEAGHPIQWLPDCYDVDTIEDLHRLIQDPRCTGRVRAVLNGISGLKSP